MIAADPVFSGRSPFHSQECALVKDSKVSHQVELKEDEAFGSVGGILSY